MTKTKIASLLMAVLMTAGSLASCQKIGIGKTAEPPKEKRTNVYAAEEIALPEDVSSVGSLVTGESTAYLTYDAEYTAVYNDMGEIVEQTPGYNWEENEKREKDLPEGWWIGCGGKGPSDHTLTVLEVRQNGKVKGLLLHLNTQSSVLDGTGAADGKCVSGDYVGFACTELEKRYPGAAVMFLIGAGGDQAPVKRGKGYAPDGQGGYGDIDLHDEAVSIAEDLGRQLAAEVVTALQSTPAALNGAVRTASRSFHAPAKKMNRNLRELRPTHSCEWEPDGDKEQTIELFALGDLAIVGVRPELTYPTLKQIQAVSPYSVTLTATLINGGAKYMADQSAYDRFMYEAVNSPFAPGAAEMLVREAAALLNQ